MPFAKGRPKKIKHKYARDNGKTKFNYTYAEDEEGERMPFARATVTKKVRTRVRKSDGEEGSKMPFARATTTRRAKAQYRKSGPTIAEDERRRLERAAELDKRARDLKERERKRKQMEEARKARTEKERAARQQLGIGLATQLAGYSHTQKAMKSGMEGWLGAGRAGGDEGSRLGEKRKRDEDEKMEEKENRNGESAETSKALSAAFASEATSFGSNMSLDDVTLAQLDGSAGGTENASENQAGEMTSKYPEAQAPQHNKVDTPLAKRVKTVSSPDGWAQFVDDSTQVLLDSPPLPQVKEDNKVALPPMSTQDLELDSDDLLEAGLPKTEHPSLSPKDNVIVRDFAYFTKADSGSFFLEIPTAPNLARKSRTEALMRRSFGRRPQTTLFSASPKMTAQCAEFKAEQCSFTTKDYHQYGFSTQILQQAVEDCEGDTESEDEEVYSQALEEQKSQIPDSVRMPPPPARLSPKVFKPPALPERSSTLFSTKGGLQIFGLSTQLLNDAIDEDELTDEDEDDALFQIPLGRPDTTFTDRPIASFVGGDDKSPGLAIPPTMARQSQITGSTAGMMDFGLSTQVLNDIDFTDDEDTQGS